VAPGPTNAHDLSGSKKEHSTMKAGGVTDGVAVVKNAGMVCGLPKTSRGSFGLALSPQLHFFIVFQFLSRENSRILDSGCP